MIAAGAAEEEFAFEGEESDEETELKPPSLGGEAGRMPVEKVEVLI